MSEEVNIIRLIKVAAAVVNQTPLDRDGNHAIIVPRLTQRGGDENLDPKTWCRFPILNSRFAAELAELGQIMSGK